MSAGGASDPRELVQLVDCHDAPTGSALRQRVRAERLRHRASFILVFNTAGALYLQRRSLQKDIAPGHYDAAAGGLLRPGECYADNARRELAEELGVTRAPLIAHGTFFYEDAEVRLFGGLFSAIWDGPFQFSDAEVIDGRFVAVTELLAGAYAPLTADTALALRIYLARRRDAPGR